MLGRQHNIRSFTADNREISGQWSLYLKLSLTYLIFVEMNFTHFIPQQPDTEIFVSFNDIRYEIAHRCR